VSSTLVDTSVLMKWFEQSGEEEVDAARRLREGHLDGVVTIQLLDLAIYEVSNVLIRRRRWPAPAATEAIERLLVLVGPLILLDPAWLRDALALAEQHSLSGYDAHWAAAARHLGVPLVSADRQLLDSGLAESATSAATRLGLR